MNAHAYSAKAHTVMQSPSLLDTRGPSRPLSVYEISKSTGFHVDSGFQIGFLDFTWISGFQSGFLDFKVGECILWPFNFCEKKLTLLM